MDSLLANYASSDEEAEDQKPPNPKPSSNSPFNSLPPPKQNPTSTTTTTTRSSLFSCLPKPNPKPNNNNPSSLFQSLPKPKQETQQPPDLISQSSSPLLSLPPPKSQFPNKPTSNSSSNPKRVVQFKPPIIPITSTQLDDDDDEEQEQERLRRRKAAAAEASSAQPLSVTSFLSAIPAPRNSSNLGVSSSGRRAIVESESAANVEVAPKSGYESNVDPSVVNYESSYGGYDSYQAGVGVGVDQNVGVVSGSDPSSYATGYSGYAASYGNDWVDGSAAATAAVMGGVPAEAGFKGSGKRRRNDVPTEILEVKQDELMKNRPREDQTKATGIAFGPSYQPVSTKGKPTKLHKRKHQIGSLYFDMKQKETELQERRSRGFLTKAETQAKYGW